MQGAYPYYLEPGPGIDTGAVEVVRFVAVDDAGFIISPTIAEGQVHGGIATGIAQALYEHGVAESDLTKSLHDTPLRLIER